MWSGVLVTNAPSEKKNAQTVNLNYPLDNTPVSRRMDGFGCMARVMDMDLEI